MGPENIWLIAIGGGASLISCILYMMGGTTPFKKFWRRFIGSFVLAAAASFIAIWVAKWDWRYLLFYPILAAGFSLGYGGSTVIEKVIKRTIFALAVLGCCIVGLWVNQFNMFSWVVTGLAFITGLTSVVLGVINPFNNAPLEQYLICQVLTMYVPWWSMIRQ